MILSDYIIEPVLVKIVSDCIKLLLCVWLDHDVAVDEYGAYDGEGEERVREDVDGDPPDRVERRQQVQGLLGREPEDGPALGDDDERLFVVEEGIDVADRGAGQLQRELAEPTGKVAP